MPDLVLPTVAVRESYLAGERALGVEEGSSSNVLDVAAKDFAEFVARRGTVREMWGVPVTELWYVEGSEYIGTVVLRHGLTPDLEVEGGHVGYHVVPDHRGRGHATAMLGSALGFAKEWGLRSLLITCPVNSNASRRVVEKNGGVLDTIDEATTRYRIALV